MNDNGLVWEDPPRVGPRSDKWVETLMPLMAEPKRWARIATYNRATLAYGLQSNLHLRRAHVPPGAWEFAARTVQDGEYGVWARYLGAEDGGS